MRLPLEIDELWPKTIRFLSKFDLLCNDLCITFAIPFSIVKIQANECRFCINFNENSIYIETWKRRPKRPNSSSYFIYCSAVIVNSFFPSCIFVSFSHPFAEIHDGISSCTTNVHEQICSRLWFIALSNFNLIFLICLMRSQ